MRPKTTWANVGADTSAVGGRTDEIICRSLPEKRSDFWNRSAPRGEHESLEEETTHQQCERGSGCLSGAKWVLGRKIGGGEDITQESPAQDPSPSPFS